MELFVCNKWLSTRIEADVNGVYYAVGLRGLKLEGLMARVRVYANGSSPPAGISLASLFCFICMSNLSVRPGYSNNFAPRVRV